jgi:hypothetical protein
MAYATEVSTPGGGARRTSKEVERKLVRTKRLGKKKSGF